jgi:hypothetical protein
VGEAVYYLKAELPPVADPAARLAEIRSFLAEGWAAAEFWQAFRGDPTAGPVRVGFGQVASTLNGYGQEAFWDEFKVRFPQVFDYCRLDPHLTYGDKNNALAGQLDFVNPEGPFGGELEVWDEKVGQTLRISGEVWHFADWDRLCRYIKQRWGAMRAGWCSDEYTEVDYYALVRWVA